MSGERKRIKIDLHNSKAGERGTLFAARQPGNATCPIKRERRVAYVWPCGPHGGSVLGNLHLIQFLTCELPVIKVNLFPACSPMFLCGLRGVQLLTGNGAAGSHYRSPQSDH